MASAPKPPGRKRDVCPCIVAEKPMCGANCWHFHRGGECGLCKNTGVVQTPEALK